MKKKVKWANTPKKTINRSQKKASTVSKKTLTKPKKKYAALKFDLENEYEWHSFKNAMKADHMADKIECLYQEVFRPHLKYDVPIEYDGNVFEIDGKTYALLWAIWEKCNDYFYPREE